MIFLSLAFFYNNEVVFFALLTLCVVFVVILNTATMKKNDIFPDYFWLIVVNFTFPDEICC